MNFCPKCGQPIDQATGLCPVCGEVSVPPVRSAPPAESFTAILKRKIGSPLLLWFCILYTVLSFLGVGALGSSFVGVTEAGESALIAMIVSGVISVGVIVIMLTAFWRVYFAARSPENGMRLGGLKTLSVLITIARVILWIGIGILILFSVLCFVAPSFVAESSQVTSEFEILDGQEYFVDSSFPVIFGGVMMLIIAVVMILINIFYYGSIKKSIVSIIRSVEADENRLEKFGAVKVWLIVLGILSLLTVLSYASLISALFSGIELPPEAAESIAAFGPVITVILAVAAAAAVLSIALIFLGAALASKMNKISRETAAPQNYIYTPAN